ncbi:MAG: rubredoxin [Burkholderiaceae bacterium]|nr:MAG: rubredoxin [Burkholderiaceae bacterium]TBR76623.1 MAG: rubredoxin [Burkholderiaceae bacterium]
MTTTTTTDSLATWVCLVCGWCYDERVGDIAGGIAPGTPWGEVPDNWLCPDCGVSKAEFEMVQI